MSREESYIETYEDCFVVFLDVLGFREIVKNNDHEALVKIYDHFERSTSSNIETHKKGRSI